MLIELITISLTTMYIEVLTSIKEKKIHMRSIYFKVQHGYKELQQICFFHNDNKNDTKNFHALKKEIKWLIIKGYLQQFIRK